MQKHHGQIVETLIRKKGFSITALAHHSDVSRSMVYQWFNKEKLNAEIIQRIGRIIDHDFSQEFPEYFSKQTNNVYDHRSREVLRSNQSRVNVWKDKYINLLEQYVQLLSE
ncbi:helix-turn-helix transcriptional regulator [Mucilaginibacter sp. cycad4]|uniref:helix-turn-helix domain-containing protein n=1 Tax=Mucilaginibacter sp. cycad4 TaxID=3342096 RepID=UPI002AAC1A9E|nr:helix-turn-helix transcriptional regulator [Mucilaginibacter gossypii]WPV02581.1 helix-turn-helix transcriptional regulator [Mucilaginibacter gossypii]